MPWRFPNKRPPPKQENHKSTITHQKEKKVQHALTQSGFGDAGLGGAAAAAFGHGGAPSAAAPAPRAAADNFAALGAAAAERRHGAGGGGVRGAKSGRQIT